MAYVYRHIRTDKNQPFYIGVGRKSDGYKRAHQSCKHTRSRRWLGIAKNGYEVEILLDGLTDDQAFQKEIEFIALYGRADKGTGTLCNLTDGGDNPAPMFGDDNPSKRPEVRAKLSMLGKERERRRRANGLTRHVSQETREKLRIWAKKHKCIPPGRNRKPIVQMTMCGEVVRVWDSVSDAVSSAEEWKPIKVYRAASGYSKSAYGFLWAYKPHKQ